MHLTYGSESFFVFSIIFFSAHESYESGHPQVVDGGGWFRSKRDVTPGY